MRKSLVATFVLVVAMTVLLPVQAQRPPRGGGPMGPQPAQAASDMTADQASLRSAQLASQAEAATVTMPTIEELAVMMLANYDADESGTLDQTELQNALVALRTMMQRQTTRTTTNAARIQANALRVRTR
ncbi:hypothetical protein FHS27_005418 [Rhodopirellula rubra]|uniref:EF-hand domain-containing protein n=1 Tax=Aporhodopirellula rubra TaxID=980271 RepID=A0A7W5E4R5_9BACT|nr:hypothetical protein [Aporhodopirellula rubra]MBB3209578.1 hypothetical protein [Aporhodopirellula rubra]